MNQYACGYCGYDMTGVERFSNSIESMAMQYSDGMTPVGVQGLYNSTVQNTVRCPRCGRVGYWNNNSY